VIGLILVMSITHMASRTADRTYSANIIGEINAMVENNFYRTYSTADRTYSANIMVR
jgi:hypothetical protein